MGINSLLKALKTVTKSRKISDYQNQRIGVDTYCWLHKAIFSCAIDIIDGKDTDEYINFCLRRVEQIQQHNIKLVMVFDGGKLISKQCEEDAREKRRMDNLAKGHKARMEGDREKAQQKYAESIDVTPFMANKLLTALRLRDIECIVAPYEADAQLAYLSINDYVDVVITEDSDLLAFGAKKVFYKMNRNMEGEEISLSNIPNCGDFSFNSWTNNMFLTLCIMAGCDYLEQIPNINLYRNYKAVIEHFTRSPRFTVPENYLQGFEKAFLTFRFQTVFCPIQAKLVNLNPINYDDLKLQIKNFHENGKEDLTSPTCLLELGMLKLIEAGEDLEYLGRQYDNGLAIQVAYGQVCPISFQPFRQKILIQQKRKGISMPEKLQFNANFFNIDKENQSDQANNDRNSITSFFEENQQNISEEIEEKPVYGTQNKKQVFKLSKPFKDSTKDEQSALKQSSILQFLKPKSSQQLQSSQKSTTQPSKTQVHQFLQEEQHQIQESKQITKMRPFKTPRFLSKLQDEIQNKKVLEEKHYYKDHKDLYSKSFGQDTKMDEEVSINNENSSNLDDKIIIHPEIQQEILQDVMYSQQKAYSYSSLVMKGYNDQPIVFTQDQLQEQIPYNKFGEYMCSKIKFDSTFQFPYLQ